MVDLLKRADLEFRERLDPTAQLIRSMLGSQTKDEVSWRVFRELTQVSDLCQPHETAAGYDQHDDCGRNALRKEGEVHHSGLAGDRCKMPTDIGFLGDWPVRRAIAWLRRLEGVGPKVAAAVLNFVRSYAGLCGRHTRAQGFAPLWCHRPAGRHRESISSGHGRDRRLAIRKARRLHIVLKHSGKHVAGVAAFDATNVRLAG